MQQQEKQTLLGKYRRRKRVLVTLWLVLIGLVAVFVAWWTAPLLALVSWLAHEAWFSDHLYYSPQSDHCHRLEGKWARELAIENDRIPGIPELPDGNASVLQLTVRATLTGCFLDPHLLIGEERFDFERGVRGKRYLNLSIPLSTFRENDTPCKSVHCTISGPFILTGFETADFSRKRLLVLAPHADDAELASFGLYSQADEVMIVTVTQGEIEAETYESLGLDDVSAATLKGRLRTWDSMAIPTWGNVPIQNCVQLGYYCMRLAAMRDHPEQPFSSLVTQQADTREARKWNHIALPSDQDGSPTWVNLVADIGFLLKQFRPGVIVTPHPERDPHPDHVAATRALIEAVGESGHSPEAYLLYANHLHDNDRWPMGPAGGGIGLPPSFQETEPGTFWSFPTPPAVQIDKAMALAMQHDLNHSLPLKKKLRRIIQHLLAGRTWPPTGENEYFRKAVRSCELFQVKTRMSPDYRHDSPDY